MEEVVTAAVCVMAKAPEPGRVKTRLCPPLEPAAAARLAAALAVDAWRAARSASGCRAYLARSGPRASFPAEVAGVDGFDQPEGDLGARIEGVAREGLARGEVAIVIGSDVPELRPAHIERAARALADVDAVLGPAGDGGFYLIGFRSCEPGLLADLPWSAPETLAATEERLRLRGLRTELIDTVADLDGPRDLDRLRALADAGAVDAPATQKALAGIP